MRLTLASSSPRRRELLSMLVPHFEVSAPDIDEAPHPGESPDHYVTRLAMEKAVACATDNCVSLGADTVVVYEGQILGKPADIDAARSVLQQLSGSAITVTDPLSSRITAQQPDISLNLLQEKRMNEIADLHQL